MILFIVMGFNLFGDGIRDALDPKLSQGKLGRSKALTDLKKNFVFSERCSKSFLEVNNLTTKFIRNNYEIEAIKNQFGHFKNVLQLLEKVVRENRYFCAFNYKISFSPPGLITEGLINYKGSDITKYKFTKSMQDIRKKKLYFSRPTINFASPSKSWITNFRNNN